MKIVVEGCAHGELETIYDTIKALENKEKIKVDLLICCGDFQACRNENDLHCMAVPAKYYDMCSFYKYYTGTKIAPILTIFVGGNHEASNYLQELPYGGWVAPNIYYLGYAGVINIGGLRIAGISGIYKGQDYFKGHYEKSPYDNSTKRSVYHIRNLEIFKLKQLSQPIDIFISHDWPSGIWNFGDQGRLLRFKPFFKDDIESGKLGSKPCKELLHQLQPSYYFAAHLHCKFAALIKHKDNKITRFLALDKCVPNKRFLQLMDIPHEEKMDVKIKYDLEWLTILHLTNHLLSVNSSFNYMPGPSTTERWQFTPTSEEKNKILEQFGNDLVPETFTKTVYGYNPKIPNTEPIRQPSAQINSQTVSFCKKLSIDDPLVLLNAFDEPFQDQNDSINTEDDSETYETFVNSRPSLRLPEPKFDQSDSSEYLNAIADGTTNSVLPASTVPDEALNMTDVTVSELKKFKRRNAQFYCDKKST